MGNTQTLAQHPITHASVSPSRDASTSSVDLALETTSRDERVKTAITAYGASLVMTGVMVPFVASVMMMAFYLGLPNAFIALPQLGVDPSSKWYAIVASTLVTGGLWLVGALLRCPFVTARSANPHSYGLLRSRLCQLKANLGIEEVDGELEALERQHSDLALAVKKIQALKPGVLDEGNCECNQTARVDGLACYIDIRKMLRTQHAQQLPR